MNIIVIILIMIIIITTIIIIVFCFFFGGGRGVRVHLDSTKPSFSRFYSFQVASGV